MNYAALTQALEEKLNLSNIDEETRSTILSELGEATIERTTFAITESLTEEEAELAADMLKDTKIEEFLTMLTEKHPELNDKVIAITDEVINEFITIAENE